MPSDRDTAGLHRSLGVDRRDRWAWLAAVALFVLGDVATTAVGLNIGAVESNPVALAAIGALGLWPAMLLLKATVLGLVGLLWACSPEQFRAVVPATLAVWGAAVVSINSYVVGVVLA
ncbi:hypothetical protein [Halolamina sediminis]|uniref:hypothetical protein n=1 Tax=Halolamina sediminis TaxID=1480675 RepID=UPI0009ADCD44|nr:hypothetical protein [Halolamina sediminis]